MSVAWFTQKTEHSSSCCYISPVVLIFYGLDCHFSRNVVKFLCIGRNHSLELWIIFDIRGLGEEQQKTRMKTHNCYPFPSIDPIRNRVSKYIYRNHGVGTTESPSKKSSRNRKQMEGVLKKKLESEGRGDVTDRFSSTCQFPNSHLET